MPDDQVPGDAIEPESIETAGEQASTETSAAREQGGKEDLRARHRQRSSPLAEAPEFARVRPFTIVLVIVFIICVIGLLSVINLEAVRDYFGSEAVFWVLRVGMGVMIVCLVVWLLLREKAHSGYIRKQLEMREETNRQLALLLEAGQGIGSTLELPQILRVLLEYTFAVTGGGMGAVYLWDKSSTTLKAALTSGVDEKKVMFKEFPAEQGLMGKVAMDREMAAVDDMEKADRRDNVFFGAADPGSQLLVPLVARERLVGVLVTATEGVHEYTEDERRLVAGLAELASLPISNAQLYRIARRSLDVAAHQRGFTESVLDQMVAGVMTCDRNCRVAVFNREAQRLTGYGFEEMTQVLLRPELSLDENPLGPLEHGMLEVMRDPAYIKEGEALVMKKDRTLLPLSYRVYPVSDGESVMGAAAVFMEAGERPSATGSRDDIDHQSLLRSLAARIEMLYTHPLSRVLDRAREMEIESWTGGRDDIVRILQAGSDTLRALLEDVEKYLNCVTTREWDSRGEHDVAVLAGGVVEGIMKRLEREGVVVMVQLTGLAPVFGYERLMKTALEEVVENAVIAAGEGEKKVEVTGIEKSGLVRVEVRDYGPGIPPGERESAFVPFFSTREGRSGLGLAIAGRVMRHLGGSIGLGDSPRGSLFYLEFPVSPRPSAVGEQPGTTGAGES